MANTARARKYSGKELIDKMFKYYYKVRVPYLATKSVEELNLFGLTNTGVKDVDLSLANERITTYATIEQLIELYKKHVTIFIVDETDSIEIYNVINEHISNWHEFLKHSMNADKVPIEDLATMDEFAKEVLKFIRGNNLHLLSQTETSSFFDYFRELRGFSVNSIVRGVESIDLLEQKKEQPDSFQHDIIRSNFLREKLAMLRRAENDGR